MRFFAGFGLRFLMGLLFRPPFFRLAIVLFFGRPMIQLPGGRDGASCGRVFLDHVPGNLVHYVTHCRRA